MIRYCHGTAIMINNLHIGQEEIDESDLEERHRAEIPMLLPVKKDSTKDLLMIFSDRVTVKFNSGETVETIKGRWCLPCK
jgi:hypothetical protein